MSEPSQSPSQIPTQIIVPLAEGFEEIEAVTIIDVLRRAECDVRVVGLDGETVAVCGAHGIEVGVDGELGEIDPAEVLCIALPGGMPGTRHLAADEGVLDLVRRLADAGRTTAAICAAPTVLVAAGVAGDRRMTAHPSVRGKLGHAQVETDQRVVAHDYLLTSQGPGTSLEFALALVERFKGAARAAELADAMLVPVPW